MRLLVCLPWILLGLSATPVLAQDSSPTTDVPVLRPGDSIRITVWRKPEISGEFNVATDGSVADPFYMGIHVASIPFPEAAEQIRSYIAKYEASPRVLVEPLFRISIGGEVRKPDLYMLRPETSIEQAVMAAGGPTENGRRNRIELRRGTQEMIVDLTDPNDRLARTPIRSGDELIVPRHVSFVRDYVAPFSSIVSAVVSVAYVAGRYFF